jgi:hypothetical protein
MKLDELCHTFQELPIPLLGAEAHPERDAVVRARSAVGEAVADDEFLADCLSWELRLIESNRLRRGLVPFFTLGGLGIRFAFGYWRPGGSPGPHEHTAWTITGVCRNELEVLTYDRAQSYERRELVPKNRFSASAGQVGFSYEPCIHEPRNASRKWALSLHISSPRDGEPVHDFDEPLPALTTRTPSPVQPHDPYTSVLVARQRQGTVHQLAGIVSAMEAPQADLLTQCYRLASSATRDWIGKAAPHLIEKKHLDMPWILAKTHAGLNLTSCPRGEMWALQAETPAGPIDEIVISSEARAALDFVARETVFDVRDLPGHLSLEEQVEIGHALEESGLFVRTHS